jgi:hypothetical protein
MIPNLAINVHQEWEGRAVRDFAAAYGLPEGRVRQALESPPPAPDPGADPVAWLTLLVRDDGPGPTPYTVRGWLFSPAYPQGKELLEGRILPAGDEADLGDKCNELRRSAFALYDGPPQKLHVEVFLPEGLLCHEVDQWKLRRDVGDDGLPFGYEHPLVVRSLSRAEAGMVLNIMSERWQSCCAKNPWYWAADVPLTEEQFVKLDRARRVVGVVIASPVAPDAGPGAIPKLRRILSAGVPVLLWLRRVPLPEPGKLPKSPADRLRAALKRLAPKDARRDLCEGVWKKRNLDYEPEQATEHVCRNIGLLYDNPGRLPPTLGRRRASGPRGRRVTK